MEAISMIKPTSKASLKQTCLFLSNLDVDKATKMYEFLVKDMDIPDIEPASRTFVENFGMQADGVLEWFRKNQDVIGKGLNFVRGIAESRKSAPLPPIND